MKDSKSKTVEVFDDLGERLSKIASVHDLECPRVKGFYEFGQVIKHIVFVQAQRDVVEAAVAVALDIQRFHIGSLGEHQRTRNDHKHALRRTFRIQSKP